MRSGVALSMMAMAAELLSAGCATGKDAVAHPAVAPGPGVSKAALAIEQVAVEPKTLDLARETRATFRYALTQPAAVSVEFFDEEGRRIRQIALGQRGGGVQTAHWDAQDDQGRNVPNGVYLYVIRAQDREGQETVYDPAQEMGGEEIEPREFQWDPQNGQFRWVMPKAGYARLRIGLEGFPHLRTLLDWEPLEAGENTLAWDGLDQSGLIRLKNHPQLSVKAACFALAPNTVLVRGSSPMRGVGPAAQAAVPPPSRPLYLHAQHLRANCREVGVRLEFPEAQRDPQNRPLLRGIVPVRVRLSDEDALRMVNERFELAFFVDLVVVSESEDAFHPFTFLWDTTPLPPGQHLFTVNVLGHGDHFGVETRAVLVETVPPGEEPPS